MIVQSCQVLAVAAINSSVKITYAAGLFLLIGFALKIFSSIYLTALVKQGFVQKAVEKPEKLKSALKILGIPDQMVIVFEDNNKVAASSGFIKPKIYLSTATINSLSRMELQAVLLHEHFHTLYFHPLIVFGLASTYKTLIFLPVLQDLNKYISCKLECAADKYVIQRQRTSMHLKKAMLTFLSGGNEPTYFEGIPNFANPDNLRQRTAALRGKNPTMKLSPLKLLSSILFSTALAALYSAQHAAAYHNYIQGPQSEWFSPKIQNCNLMSCATDCLYSQNSSLQLTSKHASLSRQENLALTE